MKKTMLLGIGAMVAIGVSAAPLTPQQALERLQNGRMGKAMSISLDAQPVYTETTATGVPTLYVFNCRDNGGYRILSADDAAYAVLGYSDTGSIDVDNMAPAMKWWLKQSGDMIAYYAARSGESQNAPVYANMERIEPLCKSKWNQDAPFYNQCPKAGNRQTYTGCVATSMAQVMYYHKYPEKGQGSNSYRWNGQTLSMDFGAKAFEWDNMLEVYNRGKYTAEQGDAVAFLMKSCGYSVNMGYGVDASGAQGPLICDALKTYFNYDGNCNVQWRVAYSASEWAVKVYDNLKNCGPIVMNGHEYSSSAGHSFVCDGYDGNGYFHFNWGWGGVSDGWFSLEAMNPEAQGIGGGAGGGFNYGLNAIMGIQPPTGDAVLPQPDNVVCYGNLSAEISNRYINFTRSDWYPSGWYCAMGHPIQVNFGITIEPVDGTSGDVRDINGTFNNSRIVSLNPGYYFPSTNGPRAPMPNLPDGRYKVTVTIRDMSDGAGEERVPLIVPYGCANYVYVTVQDGVQTVENMPVPELQARDLTLETALYYDRYARYKATLANDSEFELTESIVPALLLNGRVAMMGNITPTTVAPNTTGDFEWTCKMVKQAGFDAPTTATEYQLAIVNPVTSTILGRYGNVTMNPKPIAARLQSNKFEIVGATPERFETTSGSGIVTVNMIPSSNFETVLDYFVDLGFFDGIISYNIFKRGGLDDFNNLEAYDMGVYTCQPFLAQGESQVLNVPIDFTQAVDGEIYAIRVNYTSEGTEKLLANYTFQIKGAGIEGVEADDAPVRYFNLQGIEIAEPAPGQIVIRRQGQSTTKVRF